MYQRVCFTVSRHIFAIGDINQPIGCGYFSDVYINGKSHLTQNIIAGSPDHGLYMTSGDVLSLSQPIYHRNNME